MGNNPKKEIDLDDLVVMVAEGFGGVNSRMDKLEGRMENLENRLEKVENGMEGLRSSVNNYLRYAFQKKDIWS